MGTYSKLLFSIFHSVEMPPREFQMPETRHDTLHDISAALATPAEESAWFLAALIDSSEDAIITKTLDGVITTWNGGAERIYGYTAEEAIGRPITLITSPERKPEIADLLRRIARGERVHHFETDRIHKNGRRLRISLSVSPIRNAGGQVIGAAAIGRDITERERSERLLQEQRRLLERIARSVPLTEILEEILLSIQACSQDGVLASILLLDGEGRRLLHGAAPNLPEEFCQAIDGTEIGPEVGSCGTAAYRREPVIVSDIEVDPLWLDFRDLALAHGLRACWSNPILGSENIVLGTFAMYYRQPRSPSAYDRTMLAIFSRITTLAIEGNRAEQRLRRQARELAEVNQRKSEFLAMLGHELRNPLGAINNAIALIDAAESDPRMIAEAVGIIRRQTVHSVRLIDDLLDVSRIDRGVIELERKPVDLRDVVRQAVELAMPEIEAHSQRLEIDLPSSPVFVEADPVRLGQVIANLLSNAAKYSDDASRIELCTAEVDGQAELRVRDEGVGIEPCFLPHIFDLFARESGSSSGSPGLGLGLTLVRQLVDLHGGEVAAHSAGRGQGTELVVRLPLIDAPKVGIESAQDSQESRPAEPQTETVDSSVRILLVDDHEEAVVALQCLLELWGHEVRVAFDGPTALSLAVELQPELVLLDIGLPGMDGWEIARRLRQIPEARDATLVAVTGYGQEADRARSREVGVDHHIVKPLHADQLEQLLIQWLPQPTTERH